MRYEFGFAKWWDKVIAELSTYNKSKANNTDYCWLYRSLWPISQPTVNYSVLIHGLLFSLTNFLVLVHACLLSSLLFPPLQYLAHLEHDIILVLR